MQGVSPATVSPRRAPAPAQAEKRVCVAQIGAAHGIRGDVRLKSFTGDPMAIADYGPLQSEDGGRTFEIETLRPAKDMLIAHFKGMDDRAAASDLTNLRLYVPRERLPAPGEDEAYHADLIGLAVFDRGGQALGAVTAVHNFGAGDVIEMRPQAGGPTILLPFTRTVFPMVDVERGRMIAEPPAGAFETEPASERQSPEKPAGGPAG